MALSVCTLFADNVLHPGSPVADRPTLTTLGFQLPLTGDDNFNASVSVRYRITGTATWSTALPLFRVHPETVAFYTVTPQFAGSIFDLKPGTTYDVELHAVDPDGADQVFTLTAATRAVPSDPVSPRVKNVATAYDLQLALDAAAPGDVITIANGFYSGQFGISSAGTAANPIVIRGASEDGVILDGANCADCNIIEVYGGGFLHIENLTIQNGQRAIRFQSNGATGNVVRRVHVKNTDLGIGGKWTQYDFYIADNILEGRLLWPQVYSDDNGLYSDRDGIAVSGFGQVVAHNRISGYGDAMKTILPGARANDFYGNEVLYTYDNAIELDDSEGNARAFRNRFTNTYSPLSVQPIHGGPAYLFRNVAVNVVDEQLKFHAHANPTQEPSGILVYHNTFVSPPSLALRMETTATSHYFAIENNLFIAPANSGPQVVEWLGINDHGLFDYNGYFPDGAMTFHNPTGYINAPNFAGVQAAGYETHGLLAKGGLFSNGLTGPASYLGQLPPADVTLAPGSVAQDKALILPNINDNFTGAGPDLGAQESGCPVPLYGPRPMGIDERNEVLGCGSPNTITSVNVAPAAVTLNPSGTQQFSATTTPAGGAVTWRIAPARGSISATGLYSAPADALLGETVTIQATSASNPSASGSATVTLSAPVIVKITPGWIFMGQGTQIQITAHVKGAVNGGVTWSAQAGSVSASGLYTAPPLVTLARSVNVTATSVADPSKSATSFVTVEPAIAPAGVTLHSGSRQQFTASVPGATGSYTWGISAKLGTVSATGVYVAPWVTAPTQITITATNVANPALVGQTVINLAP